MRLTALQTMRESQIGLMNRLNNTIMHMPTIPLIVLLFPMVFEDFNLESVLANVALGDFGPKEP